MSTISSIQWYPQDCGAFIFSDLGGIVSIADTNAGRTVGRFSFDATSSSANVYCAKVRASDLTNPLIAGNIAFSPR